MFPPLRHRGKIAQRLMFFPSLAHTSSRRASSPFPEDRSTDLDQAARQKSFANTRPRLLRQLAELVHQEENRTCARDIRARFRAANLVPASRAHRSLRDNPKCLPFDPTPQDRLDVKLIAPA